jgi:hypothetical protein
MPEEGAAPTTAPAAGAGAGPGAGAGKSFSQEDVDRIVSQRVARETSKYGDYSELQARAARADELEASQGTETDKLRAKAERESEKRAASDAKAAQATERANTALMRASVVAAAAQANAADPQDVFTLLDKSALTVDEDGNVDGVADAVTALLKAKPHLVRRAGGGFDGGQQGAATQDPRSMNDLLRNAAGFGQR